MSLLSDSNSILGINARNLKYVRENNPKEVRALADNKLKTKRILHNAKIPVMETFAVIRNDKTLRNFNWEILPRSFVLKPNRGFGGNGMIILFGEKKRKSLEEERAWIGADGQLHTVSSLSSHIMNILEGNYSKNEGGEESPN